MRWATILLATLVTFAACGDLSGRTASAPKEAAPADGAVPWIGTLASATPSPAPTTALPPCRPGDIRTTFQGWGAAAGSYGATFALTPTNSVTCGLPSIPAYRFITKFGKPTLPYAPPIAAAADVPVLAMDPSRAKAPTYVAIQWSNHGAEPDWRCHDRSEPLMALEIQSGAQWIDIGFGGDPISLCRDPLERVSVMVATIDQKPAIPGHALDAMIASPPVGRAGERLRFLITLTNKSAERYVFAPCPAYVQTITGPTEAGADRPEHVAAADRRLLNCGVVPEMGAGVSVTFEMYVEIPSRTMPGHYVLTWQLDDPSYGAGTKTSFAVAP